jgi:hypothetical protein
VRGCIYAFERAVDPKNLRGRGVEFLFEEKIRYLGNILEVGAWGKGGSHL